uniref:Orn/DAP/Arg decarboxylase 2 N-terminal domain-containing protein n=1 Tax=Lotharella globosa TaxID=91324 RepID=A0A7S3Z1P6_9EUKA|mmetsp:Transcript_20051/g.40478  ORF Transcript_20051/g.40478 Transcript_20051/m.40478 type:complete len:505 (+) Transcript_20051:42-1556(+)
MQVIRRVSRTALRQARPQSEMLRRVNRRAFSGTVGQPHTVTEARQSAFAAKTWVDRKGPPDSSVDVHLGEEMQISSAVQRLVQENLLNSHTGESPLGVVYDIDMLEDLRNTLKQTMPNFLHAFAIKAAPFDFFLREMVQNDMGLEAASFLEVKMAEAAGCPADHIVFDSPAKTMPEIRYALERGLLLNCNSMEELSRVLKAYETVKVHPLTRIGLRINPLVGSGSIAGLSVSKLDSKFGIQNQEEVIEAFISNPALSGLHVHTGSQGMSVEQLAEGVSTVTQLADRINTRIGSKRVTTLDIGGGLSTNYDSIEVSPTFYEYEHALRKQAPELFDEALGYNVVTEFGRALCAKAGWVATSVEYLMHGDPEKVVAITHAGADLFVRPCYDPEHFRHRFSAFARDGTPLSQCSKEEKRYDVAGPLCFAGDVIGRSVSLPQLSEGDWIVIHDCGANTFALWSRHCSRQAPPVLGFTRRSEGALESSDGLEVMVLKEKEAPENVLEFWR